MTDPIPTHERFSTATGETFVRVLPIDPLHAWVFWEVPLGAHRLRITAGDETLVDTTIGGGEGDWFVDLEHDGRVVRATLFDGDRAIAESASLSLPASHAGSAPPRFAHLGSAPTRATTRPTPAHVPVGTRYHGASEMRRRDEAQQAMALGDQAALTPVAERTLGGASSRWMTRTTPGRGE